MFMFVSRRLAPGALLVAALGAVSQSATCNANPADPLDPRSKVPALVYASSLAHYRPYREAKPLDWRDANDTVNRIGGWRAYAREARQADPATDAAAQAKPHPVPPAPPAPPASDKANPTVTPQRPGGAKLR
jgi:hypothetical protein